LHTKLSRLAVWSRDVVIVMGDLPSNYQSISLGQSNSWIVPVANQDKANHDAD
jgi:hypothetical protein